MKGLVWNCKKIGWQSYAESAEIDESVLVFACFETGDTAASIKEAVRRIDQLNRRRWQRSTVTVFPFAHLPQNIASESEARELLTLLLAKLTERFQSVQKIPFKDEKEVTTHLLPGIEDVSYFQY